MSAMLGSQILTPHLPGCQAQGTLSYPAMGDCGDGMAVCSNSMRARNRKRLGGTKAEEG